MKLTHLIRRQANHANTKPLLRQQQQAIGPWNTNYTNMAMHADHREGQDPRIWSKGALMQTAPPRFCCFKISSTWFLALQWTACARWDSSESNLDQNYTVNFFLVTAGTKIPPWITKNRPLQVKISFFFQREASLYLSQWGTPSLQPHLKRSLLEFPEFQPDLCHWPWNTRLAPASIYCGRLWLAIIIYDVVGKQSLSEDSSCKSASKHCEWAENVLTDRCWVTYPVALLLVHTAMWRRAEMCCLRQTVRNDRHWFNDNCNNDNNVWKFH